MGDLKMVKPNRVEAGTFEFTTAGGTGDKQQAVTFDMHFDQPPCVVACLAESPGAGKQGFTWVSDITTIGFNFNIDSDVGNDTYTANYIAIERRSSEKAAQ